MYIHIGLPKTGTTSLQSFLRRNREVLRRHGVVYPDITGSDVGNATPAAFALLGNTPAYFRASHPKYAAPRLDFKRCWRELIAEAEDGKALLASSEELAVVPAAELHRATAWDGFEKRILVYLRRQDHAIEASYRQEVRVGLFTGSIDDYVHDVIVERNLERGLFDYRELVAGAWRTFGRDRVHAFSYEEDRKPAWLFTTALGALGLRLTDDFSVPRQMNPSVHPLFVEHLRRTHLDGRVTEDLIRRLFRLERSALTADVPGTSLSGHLRERILDRFEEGNRWLAEEAGIRWPEDRLAGDVDPPHFVPEEHEERLAHVERAVSSMPPAVGRAARFRLRWARWRAAAARARDRASGAAASRRG